MNYDLVALTLALSQWVTVYTDLGFVRNWLWRTSPQSPAAWGPNSPKPPVRVASPQELRVLASGLQV